MKFFNIFNNIDALSQIYQMSKGGNANALLEKLASTDPNAKIILDQIKNGANPQQLFYDLCKQRNIDPNSILDKLK